MVLIPSKGQQRPHFEISEFKVWFLKIHDFIIFTGGTAQGVWNSLVYKFSVPDWKTSLSVWRKRKKGSQLDLEERSDDLCTHSSFFSSSMVWRSGKDAVPLQRINTTALPGKTKQKQTKPKQKKQKQNQAFSTRKFLPKLPTICRSRQCVTPHTHWGSCVCGTFQGSVCHRTHTFQHPEQAHTRLPGRPKPQPTRGHPGWMQPTPRALHLSLSQPGCAKGQERHRREGGLCKAWNKDMQSLCKAGQPRTHRVFKCQRRKQAAVTLALLSVRTSHSHFPGTRYTPGFRPTVTCASEAATLPPLPFLIFEDVKLSFFCESAYHHLHGLSKRHRTFYFQPYAYDDEEKHPLFKVCTLFKSQRSGSTK